jgi:hypothetical protein
MTARKYLLIGEKIHADDSAENNRADNIGVGSDNIVGRYVLDGSSAPFRLRCPTEKCTEYVFVTDIDQEILCPKHNVRMTFV